MRATKIFSVLTSFGKIGNETINTSARPLSVLMELIVYLIIYSRILY